MGAIQLVEAGENAAKVLDGGALMRWDDRFAAARLKMGDERRAAA